MYSAYKEDPQTVHNDWVKFFLDMEKNNKIVKTEKEETLKQESQNKELARKVTDLFRIYRQRGHYLSATNPLKQLQIKKWSWIQVHYRQQLENLFTPEEKQKEIDYSFKTNFLKAKKIWKIQEIEDHLKKVYCGQISFQHFEIPNEEITNWIKTKIENPKSFEIPAQQKKDLLKRLIESKTFEEFFKEKYPDTKNYHSGGLSSFVSCMGRIFQFAHDQKIKVVDVGMTHRGRLNVLSCSAKKPYRELFSEFEGKDMSSKNKKEIHEYKGDVAFHHAVANRLKFSDGKEIQVNISPNSCHLETINPILLGSCKAQLQSRSEEHFDKILPVIVHGDSGLNGQGISYEAQQLEQLKYFNVGGTVHIVQNNQIGMTTNCEEMRSSYHPTNLANINRNFIIHVNSQNPELADYAVQLAIEYRQRFNRDIFINLVGFRRQGHDTMDNQSIFNPIYQQHIEKIPPVNEVYEQRLIEEGVISKTYAAEIKKDTLQILEKEYETAQKGNFQKQDQYLEKFWSSLANTDNRTCITEETFKQIGNAITNLPEDYQFQKIIIKNYKARALSIETGKKVDWATAEALAFGSILKQGIKVRLTGEDVERGTFSHRHMVITSKDERQYTPLQQLLSEENHYMLTVRNSCLSEYGVLGFEYGYSVTSPQNLTIWEAQFGDFTNGAQVIVDQYISSCEKKWGRMTGLVCLLPHGYDGQGPEHSNARIERFLASVDDDYFEIQQNPEARKNLIYKSNMVVCNVTKAANYFHLLRKQVKRSFRKPLIVMSPKKLLRASGSQSDMEEFLEPNGFKKVIYDTTGLPNEEKRMVLVCSGQIYFDLEKKRKELGLERKVAIIRLEQLGPFPYIEFEKSLWGYDKSCVIRYVSEESYNFSPYQYVRPRANVILKEQGFGDIMFTGRKISSSTSTGFNKVHLKEQVEIVENAFKF